LHSAYLAPAPVGLPVRADLLALAQADLETFQSAVDHSVGLVLVGQLEVDLVDPVALALGMAGPVDLVEVDHFVIGSADHLVADLAGLVAAGPLAVVLFALGTAVPVGLLEVALPIQADPLEAFPFATGPAGLVAVVQTAAAPFGSA